MLTFYSVPYINKKTFNYKTDSDAQYLLNLFNYISSSNDIKLHFEKIALHPILTTPQKLKINLFLFLYTFF